MIISKTGKQIKIVSHHKDALPGFIRKAVLGSYLNDKELDENISDLFSYSIFEAEHSTNLIINFT